jgi:predicted nucleic acid-binding protein
MSFLLDTDICSAVLKSTRLTHRYLQHVGQLHISAITLASFIHGRCAARRLLGEGKVCKTCCAM